MKDTDLYCKIQEKAKKLVMPFGGTPNAQERYQIELLARFGLEIAGTIPPEDTPPGDPGFAMIWVDGKKFLVGKQLSDSLAAERTKREKESSFNSAVLTTAMSEIDQLLQQVEQLKRQLKEQSDGK